MKSGDEEKTARTIETLFPDVEAHAVSQIKHKSSRGIRSYTTAIMLPGYVMFLALGDMPVSRLSAITSVHRVLRYDDSDWRLRNTDLAFAQWVFDHQGTIGVSTVYLEGDKVRIVDGPLKAMEGEIVRVDKRNRNALVSLGFHHKAYKVWLAFEWMRMAG